MKEFKKTGNIWTKPPKDREKIIREVCEKLKKKYSHVDLGNPKRPIDDLVYLIISTRTTIIKAQETFKKLKREVESWGKYFNTTDEKILEILKPSGFFKIKKRQIDDSLSKIKSDFGEYSLSSLFKYSKSDAYKYLNSLHGVSVKVARCIMLYTLDLPVLPVDSHILRITKRLGWTKRKRADQCHEEMEALVPKKFYYSFHVGGIKHGQTICKSREPNCDTCFLKNYCDFYLKN